jgi:hypothetical protein
LQNLKDTNEQQENTGEETSTSKHQPTMPAKEIYIRAMAANRGGEAMVAKHPPVESQHIRKRPGSRCEGDGSIHERPGSRCEKDDNNIRKRLGNRCEEEKDDSIRKRLGSRCEEDDNCSNNSTLGGQTKAKRKLKHGRHSTLRRKRWDGGRSAPTKPPGRG